MMNIVFLFALVAACLAAPPSNNELYKAEACKPEECKLPDCRCESTTPPAGIETDKLPQFVFLTFDDAVTELNFDYYSSTFYDRKNPDGCPISTTYFVSHEYSDYSKVHDLYIHNHEIALHSISHSPYTDYWRTISKENLTLEFGGEITLISHFAKIPEEDIKGMRLPFLQLSGDNSFEVGKEVGLSYDCSWPTQDYMQPGLWPYTLDYATNQDCPIGPCPESSIPGMWVFPMINWIDQQNVICSMVDACVNIPTDEDGIVEWYKENFNRQYLGNRAPFGFFVHAAWFSTDAAHYPAYVKFVDYLQTLPDVFIVSISRALEWMQNPVAVGSPEWPACPEIQDSGCQYPQSCELKKGEEFRYMTVCSDVCPEVYPWLGNPLGEN